MDFDALRAKLPGDLMMMYVRGRIDLLQVCLIGAQ